MISHPKSFSFHCLVLVCFMQLASARAQPTVPNAITGGTPSSSQLIVACSPDKPVVRLGEVIRVRAYANPPAGSAVQYAWTAPVGKISGEGAEASWDFTGVASGAYAAKVSVKQASGAADCSIRIIVVAVPTGQPLRGDRETGRSFLLPNAAEENGYGLYSYLLLGSRPTAASRERYLRAIEEYLRFPDITRLENFKPPRRTLNITYLPLQAFPSREIEKQLADEKYGEVAEWVLKQYDFERARVLLKGLPGDLREGPYIVSFSKAPKWNGAAHSRPYLFQDQSAVPPHIVSLWAKEFLNQAAQEQFWEERTAIQLVLKLRTAIGIMAAALPDPKKSLVNWIAWVS